jgi:hypothetical protein
MHLARLARRYRYEEFAWSILERVRPCGGASGIICEQRDKRCPFGGGLSDSLM